MSAASAPSAQEQELITRILSFKYDPEGFVRFAYPWGRKNTPLERYEGPRKWQIREFRKLSRHLQLGRQKREIGLTPEPVYLAISSGRGPGKSAFLAMLSNWFMSCWIGGTAITTANTETQLRSRTMAEVGKWTRMAINAHWFEKSSTALRPSKWFRELVESQLQIDTEYYYAQGQSWSEENPDAFAGAHSTIGMMVQYDEASGIPDPIWNVTEGFFTDLSELRIWVVISNPRRNTGRFFDCFHANAEYWDSIYLDSREVEGIDREVYDRIVRQHGPDSDVARVEVMGRFPRTGANQFIGRDLVVDAQERELTDDPGAPLVMGVDVARYGNNASVIVWRKGRDARTIPSRRFRGLNTMALADEVAKAIDETNPDAVFIDGGGVGGGVVDRLKMMGYRVFEVQMGERAIESDRYRNKRTELWGRYRDWLVYGCLPPESVWVEQSTGPEYEYHLGGQLKLETKESMHKRGLESPDDVDALTLTFDRDVARRDWRSSRHRSHMARRVISDYNVLS